ncbi:MAG: hypothetical protein ABEJ89_05430 [Haloarculaceae archaeon]
MDERAVSTTVSYTLTLAIAAVLVSGLLFTGGQFVSGQREQVVRSELRVVGQQVAADLQRADRLATAGRGPTVVAIERDHPDAVAGTTYDVALESGPARLVLTATDPEVTVSVPLSVDRSVQAGAADGGTIVVRYDNVTGAGALVIEND